MSAAGVSSGPWSRPWFRRLTYLLASGVSLAGLTAWLARRPEVDRWLVGRLDRYARQECGLGVSAERLEIHPFLGRLRIHGLAVGGDLFQARLLEIDLEWASLLHSPHIRNVLLEDPVLNLDQARLARIRLRERRPGASSPSVRLDHLEIRGGQVQVREPAWGIPRGDFRFEAIGAGWSANQLRIALRMPEISLAQGPDTLHGELAMDANLTDRDLEVQQAQLRLGSSQVTFQGAYRYQTRHLELLAGGHLDLVQAQRLGVPGQAPEASGRVDFQAKADGPLDALSWSGTLQGKELRIAALPLKPGSLSVSAQGNPGEIHLERLAWNSLDGALQASGHWTRRAGASLQVEAHGVSLAPLAGRTRAGFTQELSLSGSGEAVLPPGPGRTPWSLPGLGQVAFHGSGRFLRDGERVGGFTASLEQGRFQVPDLDLGLPELEVHGEARGALDGRGLEAVEGEAAVVTDAAEVANVLMAWGVTMRDAAGRPAALDMAGRTQIQARCGWNRAGGLQLSARMGVQDPRWHGARADRLGAEVTIDRDVLRVSDIVLEKDAGRGYGELWLTWADLPKGSEQIDMTYQAERLPIREGLRAADLRELPIDGTGSGTVRLHGPFDHIFMEGRAQAEQAEVYGLKLPAVSADFAMDTSGDRFQATRVRIADTPGHLGAGTEAPSGPLALQGDLDMDFKRKTWQAALRGDVDSAALGLPGPRLQAQVDARLDGPFTAPLGPVALPPGTVTFTRGRLEQGGQVLEGLEGTVVFAGKSFKARVGLEGKTRDLAVLEVAQKGPDRASGGLELVLGPESADTAQLATRLTGDFLKDARFHFQGQGDWSPKGLRWHGQMDQFVSRFEGFQLVQARPGEMSGDGGGMDVSMDLEGQAATGPLPSPGPGGSDPVLPQGRRGPSVSVTSMNLRGRVPFSGQGPLALELAGTSNLANLKTILDRIVQPGQYSLLADLRPDGDGEFDLKLGGSFEDTTLDGTLTLKGGRAVVHSYPISLENLDFTAQFRGRDVIIPQSAPLRGTIAQGALTAWGRFTWRLGGISAYEVHASLEDFQLRDLPTGFEMVGSLDASLKGSDQNGGVINGSIWARRTLYRTEFKFADLILANALGSSAVMSTLDPSNPLSRIDLNLELHLAEPWELDTNLLKLQGRTRGPFWIRGTLARPGLKGRMELLPGGRVTNLFPAGDIVLERGSLDFQDPAVFNPNIDVQGDIDITPYLVTLNITGTLDSLDARPFSTPSLRQDEIFAILIDPAAVTTVGGPPGSGSQTAMNTGLASTGTGLLSNLALADFQEQLRKNLNLDRVGVAVRTGSGTGNAETSVTVGKTINLFGYHAPLVFTDDKEGGVTTVSGQAEWRFGSFVLRLGASQSTADSLAPSGEIRHSWSPR